MHAPVLLCINQHTTFEVSSVTTSNDGWAIFKKTGYVTWPCPFQG